MKFLMQRLQKLPKFGLLFQQKNSKVTLSELCCAVKLYLKTFKYISDVEVRVIYSLGRALFFSIGQQDFQSVKILARESSLVGLLQDWPVHAPFRFFQ